MKSGQGGLVHSLARLPAAPLILPADLKEQLLAVDVIDQESVVLVHHGQLVAGGAHVQAAHGRGQLEQRDGELVVDKDLQDLHHMRTHTDTHTHTQSTVSTNAAKIGKANTNVRPRSHCQPKSKLEN